MQYTVEEINPVKKIIHFEIPRDEVARELDAAYKELKKTAKIKGFRPGKAPRSVLERLYGKNVTADVTSKLMQSSYSEAMKELELNVFGTPDIDPPALNGSEDFKYDITVELKPEIGDLEFKGLKLKKNLYKSSEDEINMQLNALQRKMAKHEKIEEDRPAAIDDFVLIDFEGFKDGEPFPEIGKTENQVLKIGQKQIMEEVDDALTGMNCGETKDIPVAFPDDYGNPKLAGHSVNIQVALKEIRNEILPDIDDTFAKEFKKQDLEDLKGAMRKHLDEEYENRAQQELYEQIYQALLNQKPFEAPDSMIKMELDAIIHEIKQSYLENNISIEDLGITEEALAAQHQETAVAKAKRHLILSRIIEQEKMTISDEQMQNHYANISAMNGQPIDVIIKHFNDNPEKKEYLKYTILEKQAIDLILEQSEVEEVTPDMNELMGRNADQDADQNTE